MNFSIKSIVLVVLAGLFGVIALQIVNKSTSSNNRTVATQTCSSISVENTRSRAYTIKANKSQYASSTNDIWGQSTEGGVQTTYIKKGQVAMVEQIIFGETGKTELTYYFNNDKAFFVERTSTEYKLPIHIDNSAAAASVNKEAYYFDDNQTLCSWYVNNELQPNDAKTQDDIVSAINRVRRNSIKSIPNVATDEVATQSPLVNLLPPPKSCSINSISEFSSRMKAIDDRVSEYSTSTQSGIIEELNQIFVRYAYLDKGQMAVVFDRYSGDQGKTDIAYYLQNGRVFYIQKNTTAYTKPLSVDPSGAIRGVKNEEFYLDSKGAFCFRFLNAKPQPITTESAKDVDLMVSSLGK